MSDPPFDFEPILEASRAFLERFHVPPHTLQEGQVDGAFRSRPDAPPDLYGAADAAYACWILGDLERVSSEASRVRWAARIQRHQDADTGWFSGPLLPGHGVPHATAFATGALRLLGARPLHPLRAAAALLASRERVEAWLEGFRWRQIWTGSHAAGTAAAVIDAPEGLELAPDWGDRVLAGLTQRVDPRTGFWKRAWHDRILRRPTSLDLGGAAHFWWLYDRLDRPIPCPERVVEGILCLQRRSGFWGSRVFGGAYPHGLDFDALNGLRLAWPACSAEFREARVDRVGASLVRYACATHAFLSAPDAVARTYRTPHKLVGTLDALAELDAASERILGRRLTRTRRPLRSALSAVSWQ